MLTAHSLYNALGITHATPVSFLDINLSKDTSLFIDPMNLIKSDDTLSIEARGVIQDYFSLLIECVSKGEEKKALHLLSGLRESNSISSFTRLGYARRKSGKAIGPDKAKMLYNAIKASGAKDLRGMEELTLMIIGIDKDNISDLISNLIGYLLVEYSLRECIKYGGATKIRRKVLMWSPTEMDWIKKDVEIPFLKDEYVIFMPKNLVAKTFLLSTERLLTHILVPYEQDRLFKAGSALCRLLKDGTKGAPLVKDVRKLISCTKSQVMDFIKNNPELLEKYKESLIIK